MFVPIIGPLGVRIGGNFGAQAQFGFGFDTYGLTCGDETHAFEDGFYVSDTANLDGTGEDIPEAILTAGVSLEGGFDIGIAQAFIGGDINGQIDVNLKDPTPGDGKIRLSEIPFNNPSNIFDPIKLNEIYAQLDARYQIGVPALNYRVDYPLSPKIPLVNSEQLSTASEWIKREAETLNGHIEDFNQGLGKIFDGIGKGLAEGEKYVREAIDDAVNAGKQAIDDTANTIAKAGDDVSDELARFDKNVLQPLASGLGIDDLINNPVIASIGSRLNDYRQSMVEGLNFITSITDGRRETVKFDVPTRRTFGYEVVGGELKIFWDSNLSSRYGMGSEAKLVVHLENGQFIFGGDPFEYNETVGIKYKAYVRTGSRTVCEFGICTDVPTIETGWEKVGEDRQLVRHANTYAINAANINKISIWGTDSNDRIIVNNSVNKEVWIAGRDGHDFLQGGSNNNEIYGGYGNDTILGGQSNDILSGYYGDDVISGGDGRDTLDGDWGHDKLDGGNSDDTLYGNFGDDTLVGGTGHDYLQGESGYDNLFGDQGNDSLWGGENEDRLFGGAGDDYLQGNQHNDYLEGGADHDRLYGDEGNDDLFGDDPQKTVSGNDKIYGGAGDDLLDGGAGDDDLYGQDDADSLDGGAGDDFLIGGGLDNNVLKGGSGRDRLIAGYGGAGQRVFRNNSTLGKHNFSRSKNHFQISDRQLKRSKLNKL